MQDYSFGSWIKRRRKALDLTQQDLAERVGCSHSLIYKIESDSRRPSRQIAELIADHLDIPADQRNLFLRIARQERRATDLEVILPPPAPYIVPPTGPHSRNLPSPPTQLVGREREVRVIMDQLRDPACRMLTLTGPGGIGKTRLAIEAGLRLQQEFSDGVIFISMAGVSMVESIVPTIADALGLIFSGPADPLVQLASFLHKKEILLVIDNMEHISAGGGLLSEILQRTKKTRFLLTSREQLHLQWEWLFEVQGLPIPLDPESDLENNSAFLLFIQCARQISQDFSPGADDRAALVRICRLVGGSPLAIELAASWVRTLTCSEIARELEQSLDILETKKVDVPMRHRSIRSVFDHSWKLLPDAERSLLMRLSVFQGGFTREAAHTVAGASLAMLSALVDKSLVRHHKDRDRYDLHELIQQYAFSRLSVDPAERADVSRLYARYYAEWIASQEEPLKSSRQPETSGEIRAETANWLGGWHWAIEHGRLDLLRKMGPCLSWYFELQGNYAEALLTFNAARRTLRSSGAPESLENGEKKNAYASMVAQVGWFEFRTGNVERGKALLEESMEIALKEGDSEILYYSFANLGYLHLWLGEFEKAEQLTLESQVYGRQLTPWHSAFALTMLGVVAYQQGDLDGAFGQLSDSLRIWRTVGDSRGLVFCLLQLGRTALTLNDVETTELVIRESNAISESNRDRWALAFGINILGMLALNQGRNAEALEFLQRSAALSREIGDQLSVAQLTVHMAQAYTALGDADHAKDLLRQAYSAARQARWRQITLIALISYAEIPDELPAETILAVITTVLAAPGIPPMARSRSQTLHAKSRSQLTNSQIAAAEDRAAGMTVERWADEFLL